VPFDETGVSLIVCRSSADCPGENTVCATVDFQEGTRRCVDAQRWGLVSLSELRVVGANDQPRSRFSRNPGSSAGALRFQVTGRPESLLATIGTQSVTCTSPEPDQYRCNFSVDGETPEGQELARLEIRDALGRVVTERVIVEFDFTPPQVIADSISWRIRPPPTSPLATLGPQWAPSALASESSFEVSLSLDDPLAQPPTIQLGPASSVMEVSGAAFFASLPVDRNLPEGPVSILATVSDDVGNARTATLPLVLEKDDTPPSSANLTSIVVDRRPFAAPDAGLGVFLSKTSGFEPSSTVMATTLLASFPIGLQRVSNDGTLERFQLSVADTSALVLSIVDRAGNASAPVLANRFRLHVTPGPGLVLNNGTVERRFAFLPELLVDAPSWANDPVLGSEDGLVDRIAGRPTFRRERFAANDFSFRCGAALTDTARAKMAIAGAWPGCPVDEPSLAIYRGAGLDSRGEALAPTARHIPVYDSVRSRIIALPVEGSIVYTLDNGVVSRFTAPTRFTSATFDPESDRVFAVSIRGELYEFELSTSRLRGNVGRLNATMAYHPQLHAILLGGGTPLDGGPQLQDVVTVDGGVVAELPAVTRPYLQWDPNEHAMRLLDRGQKTSWLLRDGGFVPSAPFPVPVEWWAAWPGRNNDVLLNPGEPQTTSTPSTLLRGSSHMPWTVPAFERGRANVQLVARPERAEVLLLGGGEGTYPLADGIAWKSDTGASRVFHFGGTSGGGLVRQSDGGVLLVGGTTLDAWNVVTPNPSVWRLDDSRSRLTSVWSSSRFTFPTLAWLLADNDILIAAREPQSTFPDFATTFRLKLNDDGTSTTQPVPGGGTLFRTCGTRDEAGNPLMLGGYLQTCAPTCSDTPSRDAWRFDGARWVREPRLRLPVARTEHVCAYDAARNSVVLFGGREANTPASTIREFADGGWTSRQDYAPDGRPELREETSMVYDPSSQRLVAVGGRRLGTFTYLADLWTVENSTARPGFAWRAGLFDLGVPRSASMQRLTLRAVAGATGIALDAGTFVDGFELMVWHDGQWRAVAQAMAPVGTPAAATFTAEGLDTTWFEKHSVSMGVRSLGQRGHAEAEVSADLLEFELEYQLQP
jgi:hypothetical protein